MSSNAKIDDRDWAACDGGRRGDLGADESAADDHDRSAVCQPRPQRGCVFQFPQRAD